MQIESRIIQVLLECYAEMQLILCAKIMQIESRIIQVLLECYAEMQLILCKDNANREQNHQVLLECYAEMQLILCKDNANRMLFKINSSIFILLRHSTSSYAVK